MAGTELALPLQIAGWAGNACFFSRFFIQWFVSERARKSVAPPLFWWISLAGTVLLGIYAGTLENYVLFVGYVINGLIYGRNLALGSEKTRRIGARAMAALAVAAALLLVGAAVWELLHREEASLGWIMVAFAGQACWSSRFVVQWWASERASESHFPRVFWWLSLVGNLLLLAFTLHLGNLVLIWGYVPGPIVQVRNLMLSRKTKPD
jgi:lipid-A-disaccharide synthase-like uncharacterized protein